MGMASGRSSLIFTIRIESSDNFSGNMATRFSKLSFVELPNSNKIAKTGASGVVLQ